MFRLNCRHQGANTYIAKTYLYKNFLTMLTHIKCASVATVRIFQYTDVSKYVQQLIGKHYNLQKLRFKPGFVDYTSI